MTSRRPNWELSGGYDGPHPDEPEPADRTDPEPDDINRFDPKDDADLEPHSRNLGQGHNPGWPMNEPPCPQCAEPDPFHSRDLPGGWAEMWCPICGVLFFTHGADVTVVLPEGETP